MDKVEKAKRGLSRLSYAELVEVEKYIDKRKAAVYKAETKRKANQAWAEFLELGIRPGDLVWNVCPGVALYRTWQRGDCGAVWAIHPRQKTIWAETEYGWVVIRPYDLIGRVSFEIPNTTEAIPDSERRLAESMGRILEETFK